jgi:glycosyltransferase involved in cell wall biosynthesis
VAIPRSPSARSFDQPFFPGIPVRIGIDIRWLQEAIANRALGGIGRYSLSLTTRLLPHIQAVLFASPNLPIPSALRSSQGGQPVETVAVPNCWRLPGRRLGPKAVRAVLMDALAVRSASRRTGVDLVHFLHQLSPPPKRMACPTVVTVHDLAYMTHPHLFFHSRRAPWLYRRRLHALARATRLIAVSEETARELVIHLRVDRRRVVVIHEAPDPAFSAEGPRADAGGPYFVHIGGAGPGKNLDTVLEAWTVVSESAPAGVKLLVVGAHPDQLPAPLGDGAATIPYVSDDELAAYYRGAVALVYPSLVEGFGLPVLEAMACGTPVITSATTATREVAGNAALLLPDPLDARALARRMLDLLESDTLRRRLLRAGIERARGFSWQNVCTQTLATYQDAVGRAG